MKILLTGATGVVGAALADLLAREHRLLVLARTPEKISQPVEKIACDLARLNGEVAQAIAAFGPEVAIHAGWIGTENTNRNTPEFAALNLEAGMRLLEMVHDAGCGRWIGFGSQAEYAPDAANPIREDASTMPDSLYGKTKFELYVRQKAFCEKYRMDFSWLRLFTCYSKRSPATYLIPYLISTLRRGELPQLKTPQAVGDYLHADDAAAAGALMLAQKNTHGVFNLATGRGLSVAEVALTIAQRVNFKRMDELRESLSQPASAAIQRVADIRAFSHSFGWQPRISLAEGLAR